MATETRSDLNLRYTELSRLFRSGWTFHQFVQGVNKVFSNEKISLDGLSFQGVYSRLKAVPAALQADAFGEVNQHLDAAELELDTLVAQLVDVDRGVSAALLRRFFERVKNYDRKILGQLLRFLVLTRKARWDTDRQDKADFLATRYYEENTAKGSERLFEELWEILCGAQTQLTDGIEEKVDDVLGEISSLREAMAQLDSLEQFNQMGLIQAFRKVKHDLGITVFEPQVLKAVIDSNLFVRSTVTGFYEREERRIAAEYQEVFELERGARTADDGLEDELEEFRDQVEALERSIEDQNVKLHSLADVGSKARSLLPRLRSAGGEEGAGPDAEVEQGAPADRGNLGDTAEMPSESLPRNIRPIDDWQDGIQEERPEGALRVRTAYADVLADSLRQLLQMLEGSDWKADPATVTLTEEARPFRLEPREVLAYRRLHGALRFDRDVEQFVLESCSLRLLLSAQAEEIVSLLDVQRRRKEGTAFEEGRKLCNLASRFESRFAHFLHQALLSNRPEDARNLFQLRMRLLRDYSGLWLLVYN